MVFLTLAVRGWMPGKTPLIQTIKYLEADPIRLRSSVQVMLAHFNENQAASDGLKQFCVWSIPQIQYRNPNVQINIMKEIAPSPFLQFYLHDPHTAEEDSVLVDCYDKSREEIHDHLNKIVGKTGAMLRREAMQEAAKSANPANFGFDCGRWCMCEVEGQVPCPAYEELPTMKKGKFFLRPHLVAERLEEEEEALKWQKEWAVEKGVAFVPSFEGVNHWSVYHPENVKTYERKVEKLKQELENE